MKIGIYKPFKKLFFVDDREDNAAWSYEIVNTAKIFVEQGHEIHILSENDLDLLAQQPKKIRNQFTGIYDNPNWQDEEQHFDRILLWCGSFALDQFGDAIINHLRRKTDRLDFMLTDKKLVPDNKLLLMKFDTIYVQATKNIYRPDDKFGALGELLLYKHKFTRTIDQAMNDKGIEFYFGGTERNRLDDYIEYVWRPHQLLTTKSQFFNINNRIARDEFKKTLERAKFSIVITDVENNEMHFISPRPYECYIHDIVAFFDYKYDPDEYFCKHDDYRRVHNFKEMRMKMNEINKDYELHRKILQQQRDAIKPEYISGTYVYEKLK